MLIICQFSVCIPFFCRFCFSWFLERELTCNLVIVNPFIRLLCSSVTLNYAVLCLEIIGEKNEEKEKEMKQEFGQICDWIKKRLGDKVASVQVSNRLSASPCVLVSGKFGWSANMERLVMACIDPMELHLYITILFTCGTIL